MGRERMSPNSNRIGVLNSDNTITSIYLHWGVERSKFKEFMTANYPTKESIIKLMDGGDICTLNPLEHYPNTQKTTHQNMDEWRKYSLHKCHCAHCYLFSDKWEYTDTAPSGVMIEI